MLARRIQAPLEDVARVAPCAGDLTIACALWLGANVDHYGARSLRRDGLRRRQPFELVSRTGEQFFDGQPIPGSRPSQSSPSIRSGARLPREGRSSQAKGEARATSERQGTGAMLRS